MRRGAPLLATALACSGRRGPDQDTSSSSQDDTAVMTWASSAADPTLTSDEVSEKLLTTLDLGVPAPAEIFVEFKDLMALGDAGCPGGGASMATHPGGCTSDSGYLFSGNAFYEYAGVVGYQDGCIGLNYAHSGDYEIIRPDGTRFAGAGGLMFMSELEDGYLTATEVDVSGSWSADYRDDWLGRGFSGVYSAEYSTDLIDSFRVELDGGIAVGDVRLFFQDATWDTADGCGARFVGTLSMRDDIGHWYKWEVDQACSMCGDLVFNGEQDLGELCVDLDAWGDLFAAGLRPLQFESDPNSTDNGAGALE